jgi:excinuclease ABC subunit B
LSIIVEKISRDLEERKEELEHSGKPLYAENLERRVRQDLEDLIKMGFCSGIENYSRYFDGRVAGEPPFTLLDYFSDNFLTIVDESHITIPQVKAMYNTDRRRKENLVNYGWRLPSALDNRPLSQEEFFKKINTVIYVSATPGEFEKKKSNYNVVEQIIRPTGLLDPKLEVRSCRNQIEDIIEEVEKRIKKGERTLIYALTIIMSEEIATFLNERGIKAIHLHSRLKIFERHQNINSLRRGSYDVIVGINLLKEGIDLPEVSLVCILDSDKPGFLRDTKSLIQIIGRASRNKNGKVILYADEVTKNMKDAIEETERRRSVQLKHNLDNKISPRSVHKLIRDIKLNPEIIFLIEKARKKLVTEEEVKQLIKNLQKQMKKCSREFRFDEAIALRDAVLDLEKNLGSGE